MQDGLDTPFTDEELTRSYSEMNDWVKENWGDKSEDELIQAREEQRRASEQARHETIERERIKRESKVQEMRRTEAEEKARKRKKLSKIAIIAGILLVVAIATGFISVVIEFLIGAILVIGVIVFLLSKIFRERPQYSYEETQAMLQRNATRQAQAARQQAQAAADIAFMSAAADIFYPSSQSSSYAAPSNSPSTSNQSSYGSASDEYQKSQAKQDAYWHEQQAKKYASGSLDRQYHESAAMGARDRAK